MSSAVKVLSLVVRLRDPRVHARNYELFRTVMGHVNHNDILWEPARLSAQGAYTQIKLGAPGRRSRATAVIPSSPHAPATADQCRYWPIHYTFSVLVLASNKETHRGLATHDFSDPRFITFVLAELDRYLSATDKVLSCLRDLLASTRSREILHTKSRRS